MIALLLTASAHRATSDATAREVRRDAETRARNAYRAGAEPDAADLLLCGDAVFAAGAADVKRAAPRGA